MVRCAAGEHDNTQLLELMNVGKSIESIGDQPDESGELDSRILWYYFEVRAAEAETVRREAKTAGYPVIEEYDFKSHTSLQKLSICLKPSTKVRPYQEKSLRRMFGNGRARSGVIVLPCGAGKTLVGCCAASTVQRSTIILCTSAVAVGQWRECLRTFTNIAESDIVCFTSAEKKSARSQSDQSRAQIFITTYSMMAAAKRSELSEATIAGIQAREWGLMVLDEVHVVPANTFRRVLFVCKAHCKLGLTATLVREDGLVADLSWMIGPKIYEANWAELTDQGYLARVKCAEVWCPMTAEFYREYLRNDDARKKRRLYVMNPSKLKATEALKVEHESRGDKIIVFSDDVLALQSYATKLDIPFICGQTKEQDRQRIFTAFRHSSVLNCIALSKVGDCAIDLPEASVIIQISSHFGSRRQEAQRLGRILRPSGAARSHSQYDSYFYSLVSIDTDECFYSMKRQQFLSDQGYAFSVRESLPIASSSFSRQMGKAEELSMLEEALRVKEVLNRADNAEEDESAELRDEFERELQPVFRRNTRDISVLSGADDEVYIEYEGNRGFANKR
jgi:DNA excision repair protein ERCC-3